jgi:hypothetical protein
MKTKIEYYDTYDERGEHQQVPIRVCVHENTKEVDDYVICEDCKDIID